MREEGAGLDGWGREKGAGLDGCGYGMIERGEGWAGCMRESDEEERRGQGWIYGGVG